VTADILGTQSQDVNPEPKKIFSGFSGSPFRKPLDIETLSLYTVSMMRTKTKVFYAVSTEQGAMFFETFTRAAMDAMSTKGSISRVVIYTTADDDTEIDRSSVELERAGQRVGYCDVCWEPVYTDGEEREYHSIDATVWFRNVRHDACVD
jgi:hypothetical protein